METIGIIGYILGVYIGVLYWDNRNLKWKLLSREACRSQLHLRAARQRGPEKRLGVAGVMYEFLKRRGPFWDSGGLAIKEKIGTVWRNSHVFTFGVLCPYPDFLETHCRYVSSCVVVVEGNLVQLLQNLRDSQWCTVFVWKPLPLSFRPPGE